ncbi:hypothetical protein SISNIDRAFT_61898 [Sistotremastrum niveocremeum HHB9708]|uniref:Uncharacterized protein n=1 Tax=Sistotremastrum niveocremeum HHB9708 TaxID=1314777 RepID=A0A164VIZ3_9AGAM|nr:hypothetical protein SISNIDRAFT_61898 [Sistotremastrum niveocremeum HHB9708]
MKQTVAVSHANYLFNQATHASSVPREKHFVPSPLHALLRSLSHTLESLHAASGHDALLLVVSPTDDTDGWLGGTPLGRKFWQDLRGGGIPGARAFKAVSQAAYLNEPKLNSGRQNAITAPPAPPDLKDLSSRETKTELYRCMRDSLRQVSGDPHAEMKWTKPQSLETSYRVRLIGWPLDVPMRNPSYNTVETNRALLEGLRSHTIYFTRIFQLQEGSGMQPTTAGQSPYHPDPGAFDNSGVHSQGEKRKRVESGHELR